MLLLLAGMFGWAVQPQAVAVNESLFLQKQIIGNMVTDSIYLKKNYNIDSARMLREADAFLQALPPGLQHRQEEAVRAAVKGDGAALAAVRNARNAVPELPAGVCVSQPSATLRLYRPEGEEGRPLPVLVYLHGGGWCFGSLNSCARFCAALAAEARIAVLAVDYPLAPEQPFPAALDACTAALRQTVERAAEWGLDSGRISVGGDSAGGNLALAVALRGMADCTACPPVRSLVLFYPVTKAWADGSDTWQTYASGYGLDASLMEAFNEAYTLGTDAVQPLVSPAQAADEWLARLPEVLIVNAGRDILCRQGAELAGRLAALGVGVRRVELPGAVHLFITVPGQPTAFDAAVRLTASFFNE